MRASAFLLLLLVVQAKGLSQVHVVAVVSHHVKNLQLSKGGPTIEDGGYMSVLLVNTSDRVLILPSKLGPPGVFPRGDRIDVHFDLRLNFPTGEFESKNGRHPIVVSRQVFLPVELRPGEAMPLDPELYPLESRDVGPFGSKPIVVHFIVTGSIAKRHGFSEVNVSNRAISTKERQETPTNRRDP